MNNACGHSMIKKTRVAVGIYSLGMVVSVSISVDFANNYSVKI